MLSKTTTNWLFNGYPDIRSPGKTPPPPPPPPLGLRFCFELILRFGGSVFWEQLYQNLFKDICYLFVACFGCKIDVFHKTVVRFYYILKKSFFDRASVVAASGHLHCLTFPFSTFRSSYRKCFINRALLKVLNISRKILL